MKKHTLKTWPKYFLAVVFGKKTFEVRKNDRDFKKGDILVLQEYDPDTASFTGFSVERNVTYVLHGGQFGIEEGYVVMGLTDYVTL